MPRYEFELRIHAAFEIAWQLLVERTEHWGGISDSGEAAVRERFEDGYLQEVRSQGTVIKQRVVVDRERGKLRCRYVEHPFLTGELSTRIQPTSVQNPVAPLVLRMVLEWEAKEGQHVREEEIRGKIEADAQALKVQAEQLEQTA